MQKTVTIVLTAAIAASALVACAGGKNGGSSSSTTTTTTTTQSSPAASPAASAAALGKPNATSPMPKAKMTPKNPKMGKPESGMVAMAGSADIAAGAKVYSANCSSCHQANGKGQPGVFPPLAGNKVVTGPAADVISIVKNGKSGKITVNGSTYNGQMPSWKGTLSNKDIAAVVSYIRNSWGNKASTVTEAQVASAK